MTDTAAVFMALAAAAGALAARPVPLYVAVGLVVAAMAARRPLMLVVAAGVLASALSARAWSGLTPPRAGEVATVATLLSDPDPVGDAVRVELRIGRRHVEGWARRAAAGALRDRLAGERIEVAGRLGPASPARAGRLARRHIAAQFTIEQIGRWRRGPPPVSLANGLRRTLLGGAQPLPPTARALFGGFVLGDDRGQPAAVADDFRASGLSHLLVVSGENVAFVLALVAPVLRRFGLRTRFLVGLAVLVIFGLLTRWEPSVLRAEAMAAIAMGASVLGRPVSALRLLSLAVAALLVLDPMLVRSVGFLLSVGACVGIAVFARPVAVRIPGPRPLANAAGVTIGAQLGVAPVLIPVFGPVPVASLPANLLAIPAAAPLVVWGMTAGLVAGVVRPIAGLLHAPTRLLVEWIALVARIMARAPLGGIGAGQLVAIACAIALGWRLRRRRAAITVVIAIVLAPAVLGALRPSPLYGAELASGLRVWRTGGVTVVVVADAWSSSALPAIRAHRVRDVDLLVVTSASAATREAVAAIRARARVRSVLEPRRAALSAGDTVDVGPWRVEIVSSSPVVVAVCAQGGATVEPCS